MKKNPFISRLATSVAAVALTIGTAFTFSACSDDDDVVDPATEASRLSVPVVNEVAEADITTSSLKFSWEAVEGASSYSAQIRLSEAGDIYRERMIENATEVTFENLDDNTAYYFRVRANHKLNESRNSAYSVYTMVKTVAADPAIPQLAVPANVMCDKSKTSETELTFMWDSVEGASAGYAVTLTSIGVDDFTATTAENSYTFTGLESGRQYFFTVRACEVKDGDNVVYAASKNSGAVKATTVGQLPAPANLKFENKMSQAVRFVWDAVDNAVDYAYELTVYTLEGEESTVVEGVVSEVSDAIKPGETVSASVSGTSMTFRGLQKSTFYAFRVKAMSGNEAYHDSEFSDYCVIKTLETDATPLTAPILTVKEAQQVKVIVSWNMTGLYGYDIQFAPKATEVADNDETYTIEVRADEETGELATEYAITKSGADALTPDTDYKVRIKTVANPKVLTDADSPWTDWKEVKTAALLNALKISTAEELKDAVDRMAEGGVLTLKAGEYNTGMTIQLLRSVTIKGEKAESRPVVNLKQIEMPENGAQLIRFADIIFTSYEVGTDGILNKNKYLNGYFLNNGAQKANVETLEIENCNVSGFASAFVRLNRGNFGAKNVTIMNNIVAVGGNDGGVITGDNKTQDAVKWTIKNNTFEIGQRYGGAKTGQCISFPTPKNPNDFIVEIENNTFYDLKYVCEYNSEGVPSSKNDLLRDRGTHPNSVSLKKNVFIVPDVWAKGIGSGNVLSENNFINVSKTLDGFMSNCDAGINSYVFMENYKPTNADVIAAGAGDPRWLK